MRYFSIGVSLLVVMVSVGWLIGCAPEEPPAEEPQAEEIRLCDLMPRSAVAEAVGADPDDVRPQERDGICRYSWGDGEAQIGPLAVAGSVEDAADYFDQMMSGEIAGFEVQELALEPVPDVGDRAVYDGGVEFTEDEVMGEIAEVRSMMWILYRNVVIQTGANLWQPPELTAIQEGPSSDELDRNREATLILGQRLVSYLGRQ